MDRAIWAISFLLIFASLTSVHAQSGRLQQVREDVRPTASSDSTPTCSDSSGDAWFGRDDGIGGSSPSASSPDSNWGDVLMGSIVLAPFYVPMAILHDENMFCLEFAPHPYANSYRGYQLLAPELAGFYYDADYADVRRKKWAVRVSAEDGDDFAGMNRFNGQLKIEHTSRWGILTNWNYFHERLPKGGSDSTTSGDTNLTYRFAQNEVASMYTGVGFRVLTDRWQTNYGINFTYGGDWFPVRPIVVSGSFDAGTLGRTGVVHGRATVGAILNGWEVFAGYDFLRIGSTNLQGPMVGVRLWF